VSRFGELSATDIRALMDSAQEQFGRLHETQKRISELVGRAESKDGRVKATYLAATGLSDLEIAPTAARPGMGALAETIKEVVRSAAADLQRQTVELMTEAFGDESAATAAAKGADTTLDKMGELQATHDRIANDAMEELDRIRKRLAL
jgi:DNA-binding protein YbaB